MTKTRNLADLGGGFIQTGTAGTPSLKFTGDPNTGIYSPGADEVAIGTGGSGRLIMDASGNINIGTVNAVMWTLDPMTNYIRLYNTSTNGVDFSSNSSFTFFGGGNERLRITSAGLVGIGTSSPQATLHANGAILSSGALVALSASNIFFDQSTSALSRIGVVGANTSTAGTLSISQYSSNGSVGRDVLSISSAGNVGIGTTSPGEKLGVAGNILSSSAGTNYVASSSYGVTTSYLITDTSGSNLQVDGAWPIRFTTNSSERARIDSSGRLLIGTSSQYSGISTQLLNTAAAGTGALAGLGITTYSSSTGSGAGSIITFDKSNSNSLGVNTAVTNNDQLGIIAFRGADGDSNFRDAAYIQCFVDGSVTGGGAADMPGRLVFSTTADGASSPTERLRIDSRGYLTALGVYNNTTAVAANVHVSSAGGELFRSTSSIKYKTDVETIQDSYSEALLNCRPVWYRSICEGDNANWGWWGFIAEEVAEIDPRLVHWKTTEVTYDENGSPVQTPCEPEPESVQYDRFVPHLLNLIKRQQQAIETLEAKVAVLETA